MIPVFYEHKDIIGQLSRYITSNVFYMPIIGPVYCDKNIEKLLVDIVDNAESDIFLNYDKSGRYFEEKQEKLILSLTKITENGIFLVTQDKFFHKIKIYYYSDIPVDNKVLDEAMELAKLLNKKINYNKFKFYCFIKLNIKQSFDTHNIYIKKITDQDLLIGGYDDIFFYDDLEINIKNTFYNLGQEEEHSGFDFLWNNYLKKEEKINPIICAVKDDKIVGAIGPLDIAVDVSCQNFLYPPYFGILDKFKRLGFGYKLWKVAMDYAYKNNAKYTIVQNTPNSPASIFYEQQGLLVGAQVFSLNLENYKNR